MVRVLAIDPAHDVDLQYCHAFRREQVFTWGRMRGYIDDLVEFVGSEASSSHIAAGLNQPFDIITAAGHGAPQEYIGYRNVALWNTASLRPPHVPGVSIHLLACSCGVGLSQVFMDLGARQFWGYSEPFKFLHYDPPPRRLEDDSLARIYLTMDTLIDQGLLQGLDREGIYASVRQYVGRTASQLTARGEGFNRSRLLRNFKLIVSR